MTKFGLSRLMPIVHYISRQWSAKKPRGRVTFRWVIWSVMISLVLTLAVLGAMNSISSPSTLAVMEGKTEYLKYRSFNPQLSSFATSGLRVAYADNSELEGECLLGTLVPAVDSSITYTKRDGQPLGIEISGAGGEIRQGGDVKPYAGQIALFADPECGILEVRKLPVWGPGQVGNAFTVRQDGIGPMLLSGNLSVFGKTLKVGWLEGGALYAAASHPIALPPGGWVWTDGPLGKSEASISPELSALFGFVTLRNDALEFSLNTETPLLQLVAPGGRLEPIRIEIDMFVQILNDPNVLLLQIFILIFFFLLPVVTDLLSLSLHNADRRVDEE